MVNDINPKDWENEGTLLGERNNRYSLTQAAKIIGCHRATLTRWAYMGWIKTEYDPVAKVRYFTKQAIDAKKANYSSWKGTNKFDVPWVKDIRFMSEPEKFDLNKLKDGEIQQEIEPKVDPVQHLPFGPGGAKSHKKCYVKSPEDVVTPPPVPEELSGEFQATTCEIRKVTLDKVKKISKAKCISQKAAINIMLDYYLRSKEAEKIMKEIE